MKLKSRLFYTYLLIVGLYGAITIVPNPSAATIAQYHTSAGSIRMATVFLVAVEAAIWFVGFYAYSKFDSYVKMIKGAKDGNQVEQLRRGVLLIALWGPVSSTTTSILNYSVQTHVISSSASIIASHYVGLALPLMAYVCISWGASGLSRLLQQRPSYLSRTLLNIILIYISVIFVRLVFTTPKLQSVYRESGWVIMLTLVAPYIFMWLTGATAAYELFCYSQKSAGLVYRRLWRLLAIGFGWLIAGSILLQFVTVLMPRLQEISSLGTILLIIYALLLFLSIGFVLIARGTTNLQKIEEA